MAGQVHPTAQLHRLTQQPGTQPPGGLGRERRGEEHPGVSPDARPGDLKRDRNLQCTGRLDVHQGVENRLLPAEVGRQPPAPVAVQQRVQAAVLMPGALTHRPRTAGNLWGSITGLGLVSLPGWDYR